MIALPPFLFLASVVWLLTAGISYGMLRKTTWNLFDPVIVTGIAMPFSAALLCSLCAFGLISWDKFILFAVVLLGYLAGARTVGTFFGRETFRELLLRVTGSFRLTEIYAVLVATLALTLVLAALGLVLGAQGDARQAFGRLLRPLIILQNGLFMFSLVMLLARGLPTTRVVLWLVALVVLSMPFSGKAILLPVLFWFGLKLFMERRAISLRMALGFFLLVFLGAGVMALVAYGVSGAAGAIFFVLNRLILFGDVYIYAYQADALDAIRNNYSVSFLSYVMHPVTSLFGVRGYDKPLGSTLASEVTGQDLLTAFIFGLLAMAIRPIGIALARSRSRYVRLGGVVAAIFGPSAGFIDSSQVLISLVGIVAVTFAGVALQLALSARTRAHEISPPDASVS
jgi:hypothetical protein